MCEPCIITYRKIHGPFVNQKLSLCLYTFVHDDVVVGVPDVDTEHLVVDSPPGSCFSMESLASLIIHDWPHLG